MSEPRNYLTISAPERQKMGKDGPFGDAQVRGGEMASQMFPPGLLTPPRLLSGNRAGVLRREAAQRELRDRRT